MYPVLFTVGPISIHTYSVLLDIAILTGVYVVYREARRIGIEANTIMDLCLTTVASGLFFSRVYYIIFHWSEYGDNPIRMFYVWEGGLSFHGGLLGGVIAAIIFISRKRLGFWRGLDVIAPGAILGMGIGRLGCVFQGCCFGDETSSWFSMFLPDISGHYASRYPTQPAEAMFDFMIFSILWALRKNKPYDGLLTALYFLLYGANRFVMEFFRFESDYIGVFRVPQVISVLSMVVGLSIIAYFSVRRNRVAVSRIGG